MIPAARSTAVTTLLLALLPALVAAAPAAGQLPSASPAPPEAAPPKPDTRPAATPIAPTPLSAVASSPPQVQPPPAPQKLVLQTPVAGGPSVARGEGRVAKERPASFTFEPEAAGLFSIGVASPQNAARLTVYLGESAEPEAGTSQTDGAIRWSTGLEGGARVKIVVSTAGEEIPFRVEVIAGPGSV